jgi:tellurite resistance protein
MTSAIQFSYTSEQIAIWLRGLLTIAWADGQFDEAEKALIVELTQTELAPTLKLVSLEPLTANELAAGLGQDPHTAENFLRTAVMVAIADGIYSLPEDQLLQEFCTALKLETALLASLRSTLPPHSAAQSAPSASIAPGAAHLTPLRPLQEWLDQLEIHDPRLARFLCKMIPAQCPFERDVTLFGHKIVHIPPLCKLNPLYEQLVGLRFRALSYLADECHEDVSAYC